MDERNRIFFEWVDAMWTALSDMPCDPTDLIGMTYDEVDEARSYLKEIRND